MALALDLVKYLSFSLIVFWDLLLHVRVHEKDVYTVAPTICYVLICMYGCINMSEKEKECKMVRARDGPCTVKQAIQKIT